MRVVAMSAWWSSELAARIKVKGRDRSNCGTSFRIVSAAPQAALGWRAGHGLGDAEPYRLAVVVPPAPRRNPAAIAARSGAEPCERQTAAILRLRQISPSSLLGHQNRQPAPILPADLRLSTLLTNGSLPAPLPIGVATGRGRLRPARCATEAAGWPGPVFRSLVRPGSPAHVRASGAISGGAGVSRRKILRMKDFRGVIDIQLCLSRISRSLR